MFVPLLVPSSQIVPEFITKIIQVFDCKVARHGNMIVGRTGAGKTEAWRALQRALGKLRKEEPADERFQKVCARGRACMRWLGVCLGCGGIGGVN
jgi:hypothetical protein